jgi:serine/threonine protein kinase
VLRGADQPGVVILTADALALALETTAEHVSAASSTPTSTRCDDDETADGFSSSSETFSDGASERGVSFARVPELTASQFQTQIELGAVLGRGASAVVRAGTWTRRVDDEKKTSDFRVSTVAVKLFAAEGNASADDKTKENAISFERELQALRMVGSRHARVVALFAACHSPRAFLMPLLDGGSLHDALLDANDCDDPYGVFPLTHRLRLLTHVASALRYLHACDKPVVFGSGASSSSPRQTKRLCSIAHLDVKPKNVLLDASTRGAKLADFGTARLVFSRGSLARDENIFRSDALSASSDDERVVDAAVDAMVVETETLPLHARSRDSMTTMSAPPGTINYMAPELFDDVGGDFAAGAGDVSRSLLRCDAWSFAMTAFETVTGSIPWRGLTPTQIVELVGVKDERPRWGELERRDWLGREESVSGEDGKENRRVDSRVAAVTARRVASRVEKCWARDPLSRPPFAETLAALRRLRRGLERGLPGSANDEEDERKRKRREDADPRVPPRGASFASALELSSASE